MALILAAVAAVIPIVMLHRRRKARLSDFQEQLPGTLSLLSGSMRAGFSFAQGLESVANEATQPTRRELQRVFTESRLGRPVEDALEESANRMTSVDLMWAVMAIRIQREVGGNLAELLDTGCLRRHLVPRPARLHGCVVPGADWDHGGHRFRGDDVHRRHLAPQAPPDRGVT
jgi:Flp pilus assembly protein TadB